MLFDFNIIDEYQLEITTYCNASCPQCPRNNNGSGFNPHLQLTHLSRQAIDQAFTPDLCQRLRQIFFCGSYGDPIMHPDFLDILRDFRKKNPTLWLYIHTNGGVHNQDYWAEIARIMSGYGQIDFGIDGLEDTLHLYRRNVKFSKVIDNARAFIQAGGRAQWNYIVFKHNEHQVEQARKMSSDLGFFNILVRNTGRFFNHKDISEMETWPVLDNRKQIEYHLEVPEQIQYRNKSMLFLKEFKHDYPNIKDYFDTTPISCDALNGKKVAINAEGLVLPCNFFNHNLYDRRFYDKTVLPGSNELSNCKGKNQVRQFLESYGLDNININHYSLVDIFNNPMWKDLVDSFNKPLDKGRLFECAMTCGSRITKVWDQGGSNKRMKHMMVTGGNRGLGLSVCEYFKADSFSRHNGFDITKDREKIVQESLNYDIFINNAFDGPFQESWADFGQVKLLYEVAAAWKQSGKTGHIINIGSSGSEDIVAPEPSWETYRVNKAALKHHSQQWTRAFKLNQVLFKTSLITVDRLDTELSRSRPTWTGNGIALNDVVNMIELCLNTAPNTCLEEIKAWVNLDHKQ